MKRTHSATAQVEVKKQVELTRAVLVMPNHGGRFIGSPHRCPEQAGRRRLVQPDELVGLRRGEGRRASGGRGGGWTRRRRQSLWTKGALRWFRHRHRQSLVLGFGRRAFDRRGRVGLACWTRSGAKRGRRLWLRWWHRSNHCRLGRRLELLAGTRRERPHPQAHQSGVEKQTSTPCLCSPCHDITRRRLYGRRGNITQVTS